MDKSELIELPPFLRELFDWLLDHHEVESSGARLKVCMLINRLLKLLGEEAEIDDELYHKIFNNMLERLKDKVAEIRAQAVHALQRLQDPRDSECPIIKAFIFHLGCDPSPVVRKAIVRCIGATRYTLPHVIKRTMDVDENVRKAAYKFIADKVHIRSLSSKYISSYYFANKLFKRFLFLDLVTSCPRDQTQLPKGVFTCQLILERPLL